MTTDKGRPGWPWEPRRSIVGPLIWLLVQENPQLAQFYYSLPKEGTPLVGVIMLNFNLAAAQRHKNWNVALLSHDSYRALKPPEFTCWSKFTLWNTKSRQFCSTEQDWVTNFVIITIVMIDFPRHRPIAVRLQGECKVRQGYEKKMLKNNS